MKPRAAADAIVEATTSKEIALYVQAVNVDDLSKLRKLLHEAMAEGFPGNVRTALMLIDNALGPSHS